MTRLFDALRKARSGGGPVPLAPVPRPSAFPTQEARAARPALELASLPIEAACRSIVPLPAVGDLPADVAKEMSGLRVRLEAMLTERMPRVVMFLASQGGEGTSTLTAQFARSLAADPGLRVLLVDVHARRPAYNPDGSPRDGAGSVPGHGTVAVARAALMPLPEAVVAAGGAAPQVMREVLQAVGAGYDWILLDGPPVLESPDAALLGQAADGVVVVVQAGRTKRPVLARAVDLVSRSGGRVLGTVLNRRRLEIPEFIYRRI